MGGGPSGLVGSGGGPEVHLTADGGGMGRHGARGGEGVVTSMSPWETFRRPRVATGFGGGEGVVTPSGGAAELAAVGVGGAAPDAHLVVGDGVGEAVGPGRAVGADGDGGGGGPGEP